MIQIDMDMPKTCGDCPLSDSEMYCQLSGLDIAAFNKKRDDCPLKEVRYGKWVDDGFNLTCSACGAKFDANIMYLLDDDALKYCPNCGARMTEK